MEWIVKIEGEHEKTQRIKVVFNPIAEQIYFYGEVKVKATEWAIFSRYIHDGIDITLDQIKQKMEDCVIQMRKRHKAYEEVAQGFTLLKWVGFEEEDVSEDDSLLD